MGEKPTRISWPTTGSPPGRHVETVRPRIAPPPGPVATTAVGYLHDDVKRRLEDAGKTLMMLPMPADGMPAGDRAAWPAVVQEFWDMAGKADEGTVADRLNALAQVRNRTRLHANREAIDRLDEVLGWMLKIEKPHHRQAVFARMLTHPLSERPVHSWKQIAETLGTSKSAARHWHARGIQEILGNLAEAAKKNIGHNGRFGHRV